MNTEKWILQDSESAAISVMINLFTRTDRMLYVVATPIGNLEDLSARVSRILTEVDVIAAEDTRRTGVLLQHLSLNTPMIALHDHNEKQLAERLVQRMIAGENVALVSDAGTPLISDPGFQLVAQCHEQGVQVTPIAGPSAVTAALSAAGIATDRFLFEGFVPAKQKARRDFYRQLSNETRTIVCFETPHRIDSSIKDLVLEIGGDRRVTICRELTKTFEQIVSAEAAVIQAMLDTGEMPIKGEFVIVIAGAEKSRNQHADQLLAALVSELSASRAAAVVAGLTGQPKSELYDRAVELKSSLES